MTQHTDAVKFAVFLEENNLTTEFVKAFLTYQYRKLSLEELLARADSSRFIDAAFTWSETAQGHNYWQDLQTNWREKLNHG
jgi:hypothetical protein